MLKVSVASEVGIRQRFFPSFAAGEVPEGGSNPTIVFVGWLVLATDVERIAGIVDEFASGSGLPRVRYGSSPLKTCSC